MPTQEQIQQSQTSHLQQQQQQMVSTHQDLQQPYKMPKSPEQRQSSLGYKFAAPAVPNLKFTAQVPRMMHPTHSSHSQYSNISSFSVSFTLIIS